MSCCLVEDLCTCSCQNVYPDKKLTERLAATWRIAFNDVSCAAKMRQGYELLRIFDCTQFTFHLWKECKAVHIKDSSSSSSSIQFLKGNQHTGTQSDHIRFPWLQPRFYLCDHRKPFQLAQHSSRLSERRWDLNSLERKWILFCGQCSLKVAQIITENFWMQIAHVASAVLVQFCMWLTRNTIWCPPWNWLLNVHRSKSPNAQTNVHLTSKRKSPNWSQI